MVHGSQPSLPVHINFSINIRAIHLSAKAKKVPALGSNHGCNNGLIAAVFVLIGSIGMLKHSDGEEN